MWGLLSGCFTLCALLRALSQGHTILAYLGKERLSCRAVSGLLKSHSGFVAENPPSKLPALATRQGYFPCNTSTWYPIPVTGGQGIHCRESLPGKHFPLRAETSGLASLHNHRLHWLWLSSREPARGWAAQQSQLNTKPLLTSQNWQVLAQKLLQNDSFPVWQQPGKQTMAVRERKNSTE